MKGLALIFLPLFFYASAKAQNPIIDGELKVWHKISLVYDGPQTSETAVINPFSDYKLEVTFTNGAESFKVQGYFAGDGNAAETSMSSGNKWIVHFAPNKTGEWTYFTSFIEGPDIAISGDTGTEGVLHGISGSFIVSETDKTGRDLRGRGRLAYVGEHYLQFQGDSSWFYKVGADAPENTLAYEDFDDVPNKGGNRKNWLPHQQDYDASDASGYTWQNGKGTELLGVINFLASTGVNAFSFLTFSLSGDDQNVFPHLLKVDEAAYNGFSRERQWNEGVHHDRFDISRLAQWERVFEYADKKGIYLHFKTQETENDGKMDGGDVGRERKLYYRELVARFGHHLALNWNLGEENTQTTQQEKDMASYFAEIDPYHHNVVLHTYPGQTNKYESLKGSQSELTGVSIQTSNRTFNELFARVDEWVGKSALAGKKWIVAIDEPGSAGIGIESDPADLKLVRHKVVWATLMAGGAGVEFYYGYQTNFDGQPVGDLACENHRSRELKYKDGAIAIKFFDSIIQSYLPEIKTDNEITADGDDYAITNETNMVTVYRPDGGTTAITLDAGSIWSVRWFNPRDGSYSEVPSIVQGTITAPDNEDWVAVITAQCPDEGTLCDDNDPTTVMDTITADCLCVGVSCPLIGTACDDGLANTFDDEEDGECNCVGKSTQQIEGRVQAQYFLEENGIVTAVTDDISGDQHIEDINSGDTVKYDVDVSVSGNYEIKLRYSSASEANRIIFQLGNAMESISLPSSSGLPVWSEVSIETVLLQGNQNLTLTFDSDQTLKLNYIDFTLLSCLTGQICDDGDPFTDNDTYNEDCECMGVLETMESPYYEAESGIIGSEWSLVADPEACNGTFLQPPNLDALNTVPGTDEDMVKFLVKVNVAGTYKIFARVKATGDKDDSFYVRVNGGSWVNWNRINVPYTNQGYQWHQVGNWTSGATAVPVTFELNAGGNLVEFAYREKNTRLDKIYVTQGSIDDLFMVKNYNQEGEFSLFYQIDQVCPHDTVRFDSSLALDTFDFENGPLNIIKPFTILGNVTTTFNGMGVHQLFVNDAELSLLNMNIIGGFAVSAGGALVNNSVLKLSGVTFENNKEGEVDKPFTNNGEIIIMEPDPVIIKED